MIQNSFYHDMELLLLKASAQVNDVIGILFQTLLCFLGISVMQHSQNWE